MKPRVILFFLLIVGLTAGLAWADVGGGDETKIAPIVYSLTVDNNVTGATTSIISGGVITPNGLGSIPIGHSDTSGGENAGRNVLTFTLVTVQELATITDSGVQVPEIRIDLYDQHSAVARTPKLIPNANYVGGWPVVTTEGYYQYQWTINTLADLNGTDFGDLDQMLVHRFPEAYGNEDGLTPAAADGYDLYLQLTKLGADSNDDVTYICDDASLIFNPLRDRAYDTQDWFTFDSIEPKRLAIPGPIVVSGPGLYDAATQTWSPNGCSETLTIVLDVYDPYDPNFAALPPAVDATRGATGLDLTTATFWVAGTALVPTHLGAGNAAPNLEASERFQIILTPADFPSNGAHRVTFTIADNAGNIITFDGLGGPDGTIPNFANGDAVIDWDDDGLIPAAGADYITLNFTYPQLRDPIYLFPFGASADIGDPAPTGDGTGTYPDATLGALATPPAGIYPWIDGLDPALIPAWNRPIITPGDLDVAGQNLATTQSSYVLIEDADADGDGNPLLLEQDAFGTPFFGGEDLIGLGYVSGGPGQLLVVNGGVGWGLLRYDGSPADIAQIGADFGSITFNYPADPVNGPFLYMGGCPITTPFSFTTYFDGEGGTIGPHNKDNVEDTANGNSDGDGGWEYGFAASPLGNSVCTDPTPNNSEALYSPHITIPTDWEYTWETTAGSAQGAIYPYEILLGGFDVTGGTGYTDAVNAGAAGANGDLQIVYSTSGAGLNDGAVNNFTLQPTPTPNLVKYSTAVLPEDASWVWSTLVPLPTEDVLTVPTASDLFGNPMTQAFVEPEIIAGTGVTGELFYLDFVAPSVVDVIVSTTDPNTAVTEPATPGPVQFNVGETVYLGFEATLPISYQSTTPVGLTNCTDLWGENDCDAEELFALYADADATNDPLSFVFMDNEQAAACNQSSTKQYYYWDFYGYGDPANAATTPISPSNPDQVFIWFSFTSDGTENFGQFGIGAVITSKSGCAGGVYVDASSQWPDCSDQQPVSVEAGNEEAGPSNPDEDYDADVLSGGALAINNPPNLMPNYLYFPPPPDIYSWELFDLTGCTTVSDEGFSSGAESGASGIDPLSEELIGGRFSLVLDFLSGRISGPADQVAFVVGNPKNAGNGDPNEDVLPTGLSGTFDPTDLTWFNIDAVPTLHFPSDPPEDLEVVFDINDLILSGMVTDADGNAVTHTDAIDGNYNNIRLALRNSYRPEVMDIWTPQGSHDQDGQTNNDANFDGAGELDWFLDETPPTIALTTPDVAVFTADATTPDLYFTNEADVWRFGFTATDESTESSSGLASSWIRVQNPTGTTETIYATGTQFVYPGALVYGDGRYVVSAMSEDNACNQSLPDAIEIIMDSTPPDDAIAGGIRAYVNSAATYATTSPEFEIAIDFTKECPAPYIPTEFGLAGNCDPASSGGGKIHVWWRQGDVGVQPTGAFELYATFDLENPAPGAETSLISGMDDLAFTVDVTPTARGTRDTRALEGSGRYEFSVVFEDEAGNLSEYTVEGVPPVTPNANMTTYIDVNMNGPESTISDVQGEESICASATGSIILSGTATNMDADIVSPYVRLYYMVDDVLGDGAGTYTNVRTTIPSYDGNFSVTNGDYETVDFEFTLTRSQLLTLTGNTTAPRVIYFKTNSYGTGGAIEHSIVGTTIDVTSHDAYVVFGTDPTTAFTTVSMTPPNPSATNASSINLPFDVVTHPVFTVEKVELYVDTPISTSAFLADTQTYSPSLNTISDSFDFDFIYINDGVYTFYIIAYNECGLASFASSTVTVCLDRGVPAPTLALTDDSPGSLLNIDYPIVTATMTENPNDPAPACGATTPTIYVRVPGSTTYMANAGSTLAFDATTYGSGTYYFYGEVIDAAGNIGRSATQTVQADLLAPDVAWDDLYDGNSGNDCDTPTDGYTNDIVVKARVSSTASDVETLIFTGDLMGTTPPYDFIPGVEYDLYLKTSGINVDGVKNINVQAVDAAGNTSTLAPMSITLDTRPPLYDFSLVNAVTNAITYNFTILDNTTGGEANPSMMEIWFDTPSTSWQILETIPAAMGSYVFAAPNDLEGTYNLAVRGVDLAGNCSGQPTLPEASVTFDRTAPVTGILTDIVDCTTGMVAVQVSYTDVTENNVQGSGVTQIDLFQEIDGGAATLVGTISYTVPMVGPSSTVFNYALPTAGNVVLYSQATDKAGNVETVSGTEEFLADAVAPTFSNAVNITSGQTSLSLTATATVDDTYGLNQAQWFVNDTLVRTDALTGLAATINLAYTLPEGGTYIVRAVVSDGCGNTQSSSASIVVDVVEPTSAVTTTINDCAMNFPMSVQASYSDDIGGVVNLQLVEVINNGAPVVKGNKNFAATVGPATTTFSYTPSGQGDVSLYTVATDDFGHVQTAFTTVDFVFDLTDPTSTAVNITSGPTDAQILATADLADNIGLDYVEWRVNNGSPVVQQLNGAAAASPQLSYDVVQDGTYTIGLTVYDLCGNSFTAVTDQITIDLQGPVSSIETAIADCPTAPMELTVNYSDDTGGVTTVRLWEKVGTGSYVNVLTNNLTANSGPATTTFSYTPSGQGTIALYTTATSVSGQTEAVKPATTIFEYDTTNPAVSGPITILSGVNELALQARATVTDNFGLASVDWTIDGDVVDTQIFTGQTSATVNLDYTLPEGGAYVVGLAVYDGCDQSATATAVTATVDVLAPTSEITSNVSNCPTAPMTLTVSYSDDVTGVTRVQLFESIDGSNPVAVLSNNFGLPYPGPSTTTFQYTPTAMGVVSLHTIAVDAAGNTEVQAEPDVTFYYGVNEPVVDWNSFTGVNTIPEPYEADGPQITVGYSTDMDLANVSMYYKYRALGGPSYGSWMHYVTVTDPVATSLDFDITHFNAAGEGYYIFAFIGENECGDSGVIGEAVVSPEVLFDFSVDPDFTGMLTVNNGTRQIINLTFGTVADATDEYDADYDEYAGSAGPSIFYAHFRTPGGTNLATDYRATNVTETSWDFYFNAPGQDNVTLTWTLDLTGGQGVWLRDADTNGNQLNVDLRDETYVMVPTTLSHLEIIHTETYFPEVGPTGQPHSLVFTSIDIDGEPIGVGDEVAVFDNSLEVGTSTYTGVGTFSFPIWQADWDNNLPGYTVGDYMNFELWNESGEQKARCFVEGGDMQFIEFTGGDDGFTTLSLSCTENCFMDDIYLTPSQFNLVSFNVEPLDPDVSSVFGNLANLEIVQSCDGGAYIPEYGVNTIGDIDPTRAYNVYVSGSTAPLHPVGYCVETLDTDITLLPHLWNCISYLCEDPLPVVDALAEIANQVEIVKTSTGNAWIPQYGINDIGTMEPGTGYWILLQNSVNNAVTFNYDCFAGIFGATLDMTANQRTSRIRTDHFRYEVTGQSYHVVITSSAISQFRLNTGDEIGIFDGDLCVGAAVFNGEFPLAIPAWEALPEFARPGYTEGHRITYRVWSNNREYRVSGAISEGSGRFDNDGLTAIRLINFTDEEYMDDVAFSPNVIPVKTVLQQNFPNPFNPQTEIAFSLANESKVSLAIYDVSGRLVKQLVDDTMSPGQYSYTWRADDQNGQTVPSGVYLYKLHTNDYENFKRMVLLK